MAHRNFKITLPADVNAHNLFSLIVGTANYGLVHGGTNETGITGAIPIDSIFPDRVSNLEIATDSASPGSVVLLDRNNANTSGVVIPANSNYSLPSGDRNTICIKDYFVKGTVNSSVFEVDIASK